MVATNWLIANKLKIDDAIGAIGVHGGAGLWGLLAVGIFANGTYGDVNGLVGGDTTQIVAQLISMGTLLVWAIGSGLLLFGFIKITIGLRATEEEEMEGLDMPEHGLHAYPIDD